MTGATVGRRVAFVLAASGWRGSHISFSEIALGLARRGHQVLLVAGDVEAANRMRDLGVPTERIDLPSTRWRHARALRATLSNHRTEIVITDHPRDLRLTGWAVLGTRIRLVHRFNAGTPEPPRDLGSRLAMRRAAGIIFLTGADARRVVAVAPHFGRPRRWIIGSPIDLDVYRRDPGAADRFRRAAGLGPGDFILTVGALSWEKRHDVLIDAVALLGAAAPPIVACGVGRHGPALTAQAAARGVRLHLVGQVPAGEMRGAFTAAAVVAHPSPIETFGRAVAEAMACGASVVAVGAGSLIDVVGEAGLLVPPADAGALASAIRRLLADAGLRARLGAAARARCEARFSVASVVDGYEALLADPRLMQTMR